jgi:hypothetical protein
MKNICLIGFDSNIFYGMLLITNDKVIMSPLQGFFVQINNHPYNHATPSGLVGKPIISSTIMLSLRDWVGSKIGMIIPLKA